MGGVLGSPVERGTPFGKHPFLQCRPACSLMGTRPIWLLPCPGPGPRWAPRVCPSKVNHRTGVVLWSAHGHQAHELPMGTMAHELVAWGGGGRLEVWGG